MSIFAETKCNFSPVSTQVYTALIHHITCRLEARQALIYQLVLGLTGENGKYNYSRAVHLYPPFFDISCSAKNYKIAPALTPPAGFQIAPSAVFLDQPAGFPLVKPGPQEDGSFCHTVASVQILQGKGPCREALRPAGHIFHPVEPEQPECLPLQAIAPEIPGGPFEYQLIRFDSAPALPFFIIILK